MKHTFLLRTMACCMAGSLFVGAAMAQQGSGDPGSTGNPGTAPQPPSPGYPTLSPNPSHQQQSERLSLLMGSTVKDQQGNTVGQINDFVVNPVSGRIQFAIISLNDQSGKLTAVPWQLVRQGADPTVCTVSTTKDKLESGQTFDGSTWPDFTQSSTSQQIYSHYGMQPQGRPGWGNQGGTGQNEGGTGTGSSDNQNQSGTGNQGYHHGIGTPGTGGLGSSSNPRDPQQ